MNVCQESRQVVVERATKENHLVLKTTIFNPDVDTLYVPDEKDHWIRGPDGILTQLAKEWDLSRVQLLAADLDPYGLQTGSLKADMDLFLRLKRHILVVRELKDGDQERFKGAERALMALKGSWARRIQRNDRREFATELSLAVYRGGRLTCVERES